jgi:hypothetical protein
VLVGVGLGVETQFVLPSGHTKQSSIKLNVALPEKQTFLSGGVIDGVGVGDGDVPGNVVALNDIERPKQGCVVVGVILGVGVFVIVGVGVGVGVFVWVGIQSNNALKSTTSQGFVVVVIQA